MYRPPVYRPSFWPVVLKQQAAVNGRVICQELQRQILSCARLEAPVSRFPQNWCAYLTDYSVLTWSDIFKYCFYFEKNKCLPAAGDYYKFNLLGLALIRNALDFILTDQPILVPYSKQLLSCQLINLRKQNKLNRSSKIKS